MLSHMEYNGLCHGDLRSDVCLMDTPSEYNFPESARLVILDGLNQFESYQEKQLHHIEQNDNLYLPPDVFEDLCRKGRRTWPEMSNAKQVKGWKLPDYDQYK